MKILPKLWSSLPLLLIGGLMIKIIWPLEDDCSGMADTLIFYFLLIIYLIVLVIVMSVHAYQAYKKKVLVNLFPLIITALLAVTIPAIMFANIEDKTPNYLNAFSRSKHGYLTLVLKTNGKFIASEHEVEYGCSHKGEYRIDRDTVVMGRDLIIVTDSDFAGKYLIDKVKGKLYPIYQSKIGSDTTHWLTINKK